MAKSNTRTENGQKQWFWNGHWHTVPPPASGPGGVGVSPPMTPAAGAPVVTQPGAATPPGQAWVPGTPGTPGVPTPPVQPFMTGDNMMTLANAIRDFNLAVADIDNNLSTMKVNNDFQKGQYDKAATQQTADDQDTMIARGLFRSSIKDADLFDIEATQRLRKQFLDDQLAIADSASQTKKRALQRALDDFKTGMNTTMVENAQAVGANQNPWQVEPTPGTPGHFDTPKPGTKPAAPPAPPKPPNPATAPTHATGPGVVPNSPMTGQAQLPGSYLNPATNSPYLPPKRSKVKV